MRIQVSGDDSINRQARTYAEYRLFAALSEAVRTERIHTAELQLRHLAPQLGSQRIRCDVTIETDGGELTRISSSGQHPYAAINRAVAQVRTRDWPPHVARPPRRAQACRAR